MISVSDAFNEIIQRIHLTQVQELPAVDSVGRILAEDVYCDIPMPPFNRSAMDGYALRGVCDSYRILPEIPAGCNPSPIEKDGFAAPIMTGAPIPEGADRVVMVEVTQVEDGLLRISSMPDSGANICFKAEDITQGEKVLSAGTRLSPSEVGIASMAGRKLLKVFTAPEVSILTTGSEVIPPDMKPSPGQVRNANGPLMESFLRYSGYPPAEVIHAEDNPQDLAEALSRAADNSSFILTAGGISMGTRDYIPQVVEDLGFKFHFRKVAQKPGKPFSFATRESDGKVLFGLPGNPVSVLVSLEMYVLAALRYSEGRSCYRKKNLRAVVDRPLKKKAGRLYYYRAMAKSSNGKWTVEVPSTSGSGDLMSTRGTNSLVWLPAESTGVPAETQVAFTLMSWSGGESCWE